MDKIRITTDDLARTDLPDAAGADTPVLPPTRLRAPAAPPAGAIPLAPRRRRLPWPAVVGALAAVLLAIALLAALSSGRGMSLEEWKSAEIRQLNTDLAHSPKVKEYIEGIHPLVTYTGANVKSIDATTVDGSRRAGKDGSNISEVTFVVTYHWSGPVQKNGYTEVLHVYDMQSKQMKSSRYLDTTALVNLDNINWFQLGEALGSLLL